MEIEELTGRFIPPGTPPSQTPVRRLLLEAALSAGQYLPPSSREVSIFITKMEEAADWAAKAVARSQ
jgi:hypothetical protein